MNPWRSQRYLQTGQRNGVPPDVLSNAVETIRLIKRANPQVPPLLTLRHLAHETDVPYMFLRAVIARSPVITPYAVFKLKKKNVGHQPDRFRFVCAPHPLLLKVQRWIHNNILVHGERHDASVAYYNDSRIREIAKLHCGATWLIKLDVTNFFESILEPKVYRVFRNFGYQPLMAFELSRLCTRERFSKNPKMPNSGRWKLYSNVEISKHLPGSPSRAIGHLPQGAATSPLLANLASQALDEAISKIANSFGVTYTRYADDITFSSLDKTFCRKKAIDLIHQTNSALRANGLWPNHSKTQIVPPSARKIVLGLTVNDKEPHLTKEFKNNLRRHIHFLTLQTVGPVAHAAHSGFHSVLGLQHHVFGLAAFAIGIEEDWGRKRMSELRAVPWPTGNAYFP